MINIENSQILKLRISTPKKVIVKYVLKKLLLNMCWKSYELT